MCLEIPPNEIHRSFLDRGECASALGGHVPTPPERVRRSSTALYSLSLSLSLSLFTAFPPYIAPDISEALAPESPARVHEAAAAEARPSKPLAGLERRRVGLPG